MQNKKVRCSLVPSSDPDGEIRVYATGLILLLLFFLVFPVGGFALLLGGLFCNSALMFFGGTALVVAGFWFRFR